MQREVITMGFRFHSPLIAATAIVLAVSSPAQPEMLTITNIDGRVEVPATTDHVPQTGITVEAWTYFDPAMPGGYAYPTIVRKNAGSWSYILRRTFTGFGEIRWFFNTGTGNDNIFTLTPAPDLTWVHIAATYDNQVARLYLDGVQVASGPNSGGPLVDTGGALQIAQGHDVSETWQGHLDEIRIWARARTAAEIQETMYLQIYAAPDLVSSWHFNGNYLDSSGTHHGSPTGGVSLTPSTSPLLGTALSAPPYAPLGVPLVFQIITPQPLQPYAFDLSLVGNYPGLALPPPLTGVLPLEPPFLNLELGALVPGTFIDFWGITDAANQASPTLMVPPAPQLAGLAIHAAYLTLDPVGPQGIGTASNGSQTTLLSLPPQVIAVSPSTLVATLPTAVTVTGANFLPGCTLHIGGVLATNVTFVDSSTITATSPPGPVGPADVTVTNPDSLGDTLAGGVTYVPPLQISAVSPVVALAGTPVAITGTGFQPGLQIYLGSALAVPTSVSASQVSFQTPPAVPCGGPLLVVNPDGQSDSAVFNPTPHINSVSAGVGPAAGGGVITLLGGYFFPGTTIAVGGVPATITAISPTVITAVAPPGTPGPAVVTVASLSGCSATTLYLYQ